MTGETNIYERERRTWTMAKKNNKKDKEGKASEQNKTKQQETDRQAAELDSQNQDESITTKSRKINWKKIVKIVIAPSILTIVLTIVIDAMNLAIQFHDMQRDIDNLQAIDISNRLTAIETSLNLLVGQDVVEDPEVNVEEDVNQSANRDDKGDNETVNKDDIIDREVIYGSYTSIGKSAVQLKTNETTSCLATPLKCKASDTILVERGTRKEYKAKQLVDQKILVTYMSDGQEVYFYGQYNDKNQWDKDCIINVYKANKLVMIHEANYKDGKLKKYRQVFTFNTQREKLVWAISRRKHIDDGNIGSTWTYFFDKDVIKDFDFDSVKAEDILGVADFKKSKSLTMEGFYHGRTSGGGFNDDSMDAYMIKYKKDGTIRSFYTGIFEKGTYNDDSREAWHIVIDKAAKCYLWQQGYFSDGRIDRDNILNQNPLHTEKKINDHIEHFNINKKYLTWNKKLFKIAK